MIRTVVAICPNGHRITAPSRNVMPAVCPAAHCSTPIVPR